MRVLADGCFDPIHVGHIRYLQEASKLACGDGDELWVRIAPDDAVRQKGREPFQRQDERMECVRAIVPGALVVSHYELSDALLDVRPNIFVKGDDWLVRLLPQSVVDVCDRVNARIWYTRTSSLPSTERLHGLYR